MNDFVNCLEFIIARKVVSSAFINKRIEWSHQFFDDNSCAGGHKEEYSAYHTQNLLDSTKKAQVHIFFGVLLAKRCGIYTRDRFDSFLI